MSAARAAGVVRRFPTLKAVMDEYARADLSLAAKRALLADCDPGKQAKQAAAAAAAAAPGAKPKATKSKAAAAAAAAGDLGEDDEGGDDNEDGGDAGGGGGGGGGGAATAKARLMTKLSADVYAWLTTREPFVLLGQGNGRS